MIFLLYALDQFMGHRLSLMIEAGDIDALQFADIPLGLNLSGPLRKAIHIQCLDAVIVLMEMGADITKLPLEERRYAYRALAGRHIKTGNRAALLEMLDQEVVDVNAKTEEEVSNSLNALPDRLLHLAIKSKQEEVALLLIERGADVHMPNWHWTPMGLAVKYGCLNIIRELHTRGVSIKRNLERQQYNTASANLFVRMNPLSLEECGASAEVIAFVNDLES